MQSNKEMAFYEPTPEERERINADCDAFYEALNGSREARDGLLKAGLTAVRVGSGGKLKEDEE